MYGICHNDKLPGCILNSIFNLDENQEYIKFKNNINSDKIEDDNKEIILKNNSQIETEFLNFTISSEKFKNETIKSFQCNHTQI